MILQHRDTPDVEACFPRLLAGRRSDGGTIVGRTFLSGSNRKEPRCYNPCEHKLGAHGWNYLALLSSVFLSLCVWAESPAQEPKTEESGRRMEFMKESATVYEIDLVEQRERLKLHPEPLLRWDNPVSGVKDGIIAMWTSSDGRPQVLAQVFQSKDKYWLHEFQSMASVPLVASLDRRPIWKPNRTIVQMKPVPDAPEPAKNQNGRLTQMRTLARRFSANVDFKVNYLDTKTSRYELRLLPQPVHRYGKEDTDLTDGALFAFVQGTNPELWLLVEVRRGDAGIVWQYGLAPMTGYAVRASHPSGLAWECAYTDEDKRGSVSPYFIRTFARE